MTWLASSATVGFRFCIKSASSNSPFSLPAAATSPWMSNSPRRARAWPTGSKAGPVTTRLIGSLRVVSGQDTDDDLGERRDTMFV